ncbi:MAG: hypothetical protein OHK0039_32050 [Bacteroidia bacterium]
MKTSLYLTHGWLLPLLLVLSACESYEPYPRPFGYPRIDLPVSRDYRVFENETCPFTFDYPAYGRVSRDQQDSCWTDIHFASFDLKWHITYRDAGAGHKSRSTHFEEYRRLVYKHSKKATQIRETALEVPAGRGTLFEIYGEVGTPAQLFLHDTTDSRVVMMSCYFRTAQKNDSLQPVINYVKEEMRHMAQSLVWRTE